MAEKNYYQILGVDYRANNQEIKQAYRELARKYHPDISDNKNAALILGSVNEAYGVLSNPHKRRNYDLFVLKEYPDIILYEKNIQDIYKRIIELRKSTVQLNKYRMDKQAVFNALLPFIDDESILIIRQSEQASTKKNLVEEVLGIAMLLHYPDQKVIVQQLLKIGIEKQQIQSFLQQQKTVHFFQRYQLLIAVAVAIVLVLVLMNVF